MLRASWIASLISLIMGLFSNLPGNLASKPSDVGYARYNANDAAYGDLTKTVIGPVSQSDFMLLAKLISAESRGEPYLGQVAVGASVLNRVKSPEFPKSIPGVVNQRVEGYFQYSPVLDGQIHLPPTEEAKRAAYAALSGSDPSGGALHFFNPTKTNDKWVRSQRVINRIGNHVFMS